MPTNSPSVDEIDAYARYRATNIVSPSARRGAWLLLAWFGAYAALAVAASWLGVFANISANYFALTVVTATAALSVAYFRSFSVRMLAERLGPYKLAGFHVWRIPAGLAFLYYGAQGWLPEVFVVLAGWGDILAGTLAAVLMLLQRSARMAAGFHVIGFADFIVAVGTGVTLTLFAPASMTAVVDLPIALIPLVGVPLSGATHIAAFHIIWRGRRASTHASDVSAPSSR